MTAKYRGDIDGLRAVAVTLVVGFHAFPDIVRGGFVGVDVFFVISGYLITGIILSELDSSRFSFARFYARRVRRIVPALALIIAASLIIGWSQLLPAKYQELGLHGLAGALFFPNFLSWSEVGYFDAAAETKPLLHLWSLGVEEQFYLVWPLLVLLLRKWDRLTVGLSVVVATSLIYSCFAVGEAPASAFYAPWSRLWELGLGGILASNGWRVQGRPLIGDLGNLLIVASAFFLTRTSPFPGLLALLPVTGAALVLVFGSQVLDRKWFVSIGLASYPLYLWHWPLLSFAVMAGVASIPVRIGLVIASVLLAGLTTFLVEQPIRFGFLKPRGVGVAMASLACVVAVSAFIWQSGGVPRRYPEEIQRALATLHYQPGADARSLRCWLTSESPFHDYASECAVGRILVWGDSHAARLYSGLKRDGIDIAQFTRDGCAPSAGGPLDNCSRSNAAILRKIAELKPKRVILAAAWANLEMYQTADVRDQGLVNALIVLKKSVEDVVVVGQGPFWSPDLPTQVYESWRTTGALPDRLPPKPLPYARINNALAKMSAAAGARFVSAFDALCDDRGCLTHTPTSKGELLSWDYGHATTAGARYIAKLLNFD